MGSSEIIKICWMFVKRSVHGFIGMGFCRGSLESIQFMFWNTTWNSLVFFFAYSSLFCQLCSADMLLLHCKNSVFHTQNNKLGSSEIIKICWMFVKRGVHGFIGVGFCRGSLESIQFMFWNTTWNSLVAQSNYFLN